MLGFFFSPSGRFTRLQWWMFGLLQFVLIAAAFGMAMTGVSFKTDAMIIAGLLAILPIAWSGWCANIKRYHDHGKSGLWSLITFVPVVGPIWIFVELGLLAGDEGENRFGPPSGAARRMTAAEAPVNQRLAKIDDEYFRQLLAKQAAAVTTAPSHVAAAPGRPVFGKRV